MSRRASFTASFKLSACKVAEEEGNRSAGRKFGVSEPNIRRWRAKKPKLVEMPKNKKALRGASAKWPKLEEELLAWVTDKRKGGHAISTTALRLKARGLAGVHGADDFKASPCWAYRFMDRHGLSVRRRTHIAQRLPEDLEDKTIKFQRYVIKIRREHEYPLSRIGNADQTPLTFDIPSNTTVAQRGEKTVTMKTTGHEKDRFTVMLACTADGGKLPPFVVFKRKTLPKDKFPAGIFVRVHPKGWMDDDLVKDWLGVVWARVGGLCRRRSLLVLDAFRCHKTEQTKTTLRRLNTDLAMIPGGMTSLLQPLDVAVNKPFKDRLRQKWSTWILEGVKSYTKMGRMRKVDLPTICSWIVEVWDEIPNDIIKRAFLKCCISNSMDGTEDDVLWEDGEDVCSNDSDSASDADLMYADDELRALFQEDTEEEDFLGF